MFPLRRLGARVVSPERELPIGVRHGHVVEFIGRAYRRLLRKLDDGGLSGAGGEGSEPERRRPARGRQREDSTRRGGARAEEGGAEGPNRG